MNPFEHPMDITIPDSQVYKCLDQPKPDYLSTNEWDQLKVTKAKQLLSFFITKTDLPWNPEAILKLLEIKKPVALPPEKWKDIQAELEKRYLSKSTQEYARDLTPRLLQPKPDSISSNTWTELQSVLAQRHIETLSAKLESQESPTEFLNRQNLNPLPKEAVERLRKRAYNLELANLPSPQDEFRVTAFLKAPKPSWITDEDYTRFKDVTERTLRGLRQTITNELIQSALQQILTATPINDTFLQQLAPDLQQKLKRLEEQIRVTKEKSASDEQRISAEWKRLTPLKDQVLKQLDILNNFLADPSVIDRIETYDNPFAPGNMEVLKKLSARLRLNAPGPAKSTP